MHFLFAADPLRPRSVDEHYAPQNAAFASAGFSTSPIADEVLETGSGLGDLPAGSTVVYRGWMIDERQYRTLASAVERRGGALLTSPDAYLRTHHLPLWYPRLRDLTPETVILPPDVDLEAELRRLAWPAFFIKDYVKSLKTSGGSLLSDPAAAGHLADQMRLYRGVIEGGFCIRRVERFQPESEKRYFVLRGRAFAALPQTVPEIVVDVASRIDSPFFSVDVAMNDEKKLRVVEIGDGQVSDLVGWTVEAFVRMWGETDA
jgi:hypothetical protein